MAINDLMERNKTIFFKKIDELKKVSFDQRKSIISGDIDIFLSLERFRSQLRKDIEELGQDIQLNMQNYKKYMDYLSEMERIEKENRALLIKWSKNLKKESGDIMEFRKVSKAYFNNEGLPSKPRLVNKVT